MESVAKKRHAYKKDVYEETSLALLCFALHKEHQKKMVLHSTIQTTFPETLLSQYTLYLLPDFTILRRMRLNITYTESCF